MQNVGAPFAQGFFIFINMENKKNSFIKEIGLTWVAAELILGQRFGYVCLDRSWLQLLV